MQRGLSRQVWDYVRAGTRSAAHHARRSLGIGAGLLLASLLPILPGCQAPAPPTGPTQAILRIPDYEAFVDDSLSLLRRWDFAPEFVDREQGVIVSQPTTSGQWFEFWRVDSRGGYQTLESSLHTMRRIITVHIERLDNAAPDTQQASSAPAATAVAAEGTPAVGGRYRLVVRVDKSRHSAPERQFTTTSGALTAYSAHVPTAEGTRGRARTDWVPLGRDGLLESFVLENLTRARPDVELAE